MMLAFSGTVLAQQQAATKMAIMDVQRAISQSSDGQQAAREITERFAPKRAELEKQQKEIADLQQQLNAQDKTLSEDARTKLMRSIDDKTRAFQRNNEDATAGFQTAQQDAVNEIGRKMLGIVDEYAKKNGLAMILDVSSPQTPVLYADVALDITDDIIGMYNQATAKPAAAAPPAPAAPAASAPALPAGAPPAAGAGASSTPAGGSAPAAPAP
jgi:outer membrane protein